MTYTKLLATLLISCPLVTYAQKKVALLWEIIANKSIHSYIVKSGDADKTTNERWQKISFKDEKSNRVTIEIERIKRNFKVSYTEQMNEADSSEYEVKEAYNIDTQNPMASHDSERSLLQNALLFVKNPVAMYFDESTGLLVAKNDKRRINIPAYWHQGLPLLHEVPQLTCLILDVESTNLWTDTISINTPTGIGRYITEYKKIANETFQVEGFYLPPTDRQADKLVNKEEYVYNEELTMYEYTGTMEVTPRGFIKNLLLDVESEVEVSNSIAKFRNKQKGKFRLKIENSLQ